MIIIIISIRYQVPRVESSCARFTIERYPRQFPRSFAKSLSQGIFKSTFYRTFNEIRIVPLTSLSLSHPPPSSTPASDFPSFVHTSLIHFHFYFAYARRCTATAFVIPLRRYTRSASPLLHSCGSCASFVPAPRKVPANFATQ